MNEVTVRTYSVRSDAEIGRMRLEADGIRAYVAADDEGGLNPGFYRDYGVRLVVRAVDLEAARESLAIEHIVVPRPVAHAMERHAVWTYPHEACGLVLFDGERPVFAWCLTNTDESEHRFTIDPVEHHGVLRFAERQGWDVGGVFHSHPRSAAHPSASDRSGGGDPQWIHFILGPVTGSGGELRAFRFEGDMVHEVSLEVSP